MPPTRLSLSPNGSVGVEPITSSAQHGAVDLINQLRSRSVGALEHESKSCASPDGESQTMKVLHNGRLRRSAALLK